MFGKLVAITGDVGEIDLGISTKDRQLLIENVEIVIHSAATLDFQASLKPTVHINLLGTRRVMDLSQQMKNIKVTFFFLFHSIKNQIFFFLQSMVHVSSAYVNAYMLEAEEKLYPAPQEAEKLIDLVNTLSDEAIAELTPK